MACLRRSCASGFEHRATRDDHVTAALLVLHDLEVDALAHQDREVCVRGVEVHARGGSEGAQAVDVDLDAALDHAGDQTADQRAVLGGLLDLGLGFFFAQGLAGEDHQTAAQAVVVDAGHEAITHGGDQVIGLHLVAIEDGQRFAGQVDHDRGLEHRGDLAEHLFTGVKRGTVAGAMMLRTRG